MNDKNKLKEIWNNFTFKEIIEAGYECEKLQAIDIIKEAEEIDRESNTLSLKGDFLDDLECLFENYNKRDLPSASEILYIHTDYYSEDSLINFFDNNDLLENLKDTYTLNTYVEDEITEFLERNPNPICEQNGSIKDASLLNNDDFKRFLCDILNCNYHISNENLLNTIKEKI